MSTPIIGVPEGMQLQAPIDLPLAWPGVICKTPGARGLTKNGTEVYCRIPPTGGAHHRWGAVQPPEKKKRRRGRTIKGAGLERRSIRQWTEAAPAATDPLPEHIAEQLNQTQIGVLRAVAGLPYECRDPRRSDWEKLDATGLVQDGNLTTRGAQFLREHGGLDDAGQAALTRWTGGHPVPAPVNRQGSAPVRTAGDVDLDVTEPDEPMPGWETYDACTTCQAPARRACRNLRRSRGGVLVYNEDPHKRRPRLPADAARPKCGNCQSWLDAPGVRESSRMKGICTDCAEQLGKPEPAVHATTLNGPDSSDHWGWTCICRDEASGLEPSEVEAHAEAHGPLAAGSIRPEWCSLCGATITDDNRSEQDAGKCHDCQVDEADATTAAEPAAAGEVTIVCDGECGARHRGEYAGDTITARRAAARKLLATQGWQVDTTDLCPNCRVKQATAAKARGGDAPAGEWRVQTSGDDGAWRGKAEYVPADPQAAAKAAYDKARARGIPHLTDDEIDQAMEYVDADPQYRDTLRYAVDRRQQGRVESGRQQRIAAARVFRRGGSDDELAAARDAAEPWDREVRDELDQQFYLRALTDDDLAHNAAGARTDFDREQYSAEAARRRQLYDVAKAAMDWTPYLPCTTDGCRAKQGEPCRDLRSPSGFNHTPHPGRGIADRATLSAAARNRALGDLRNATIEDLTAALDSDEIGPEARQMLERRLAQARHAADRDRRLDEQRTAMQDDLGLPTPPPAEPAETPYQAARRRAAIIDSAGEVMELLGSNAPMPIIRERAEHMDPAVRDAVAKATTPDEVADAVQQVTTAAGLTQLGEPGRVDAFRPGEMRSVVGDRLPPDTPVMVLKPGYRIDDAHSVLAEVAAISDTTPGWEGHGLCDTCGAKPGRPCWDLRSSTGAVTSTAHDGRPHTGPAPAESAPPAVRRSAHDVIMGVDLDRTVKPDDVPPTDQLDRLSKGTLRNMAASSPGSPMSAAAQAALDRRDAADEAAVQRTAAAAADPGNPLVTRDRRPAPEPVSLEDQIRTVYHELAAEPGGYVMLSRLRPRFPDVPRQELDSALDRLLNAPDVDLEPEHNQKTLREIDRSSAVFLGGEPRHLLAIGQKEADNGDWAAYGPCGECSAVAGHPCWDLRAHAAFNTTAHPGRPMIRPAAPHRAVQDDPAGRATPAQQGSPAVPVEPAAPAAPEWVPATAGKTVSGSRSATPPRENTWGVIPDHSDPDQVHYHDDGQIGYAVKRMGDDRYMDVDGQPLANRLGQVATRYVGGRTNGRQQIRELEALRDRLPECRARRELTYVIGELGIPADAPTPPAFPAACTLEPLRRAHARLLECPLAYSEDQPEIRLLVEAAEKFAAGRSRGAILVNEVRHGVNQWRHESTEGKFEIDRILRDACRDMEAMLASKDETVRAQISPPRR